MGWAINYGLSTDETDVKAIRSLVQSLWVLATRLPFARVSDIVEMRGDECLHHDRDDPHRDLKIQARWLLLDAGRLVTVSPLHIIAFAAERGEGSEPAIIGLCRYPDVIDSEVSNTRLCTKLKGWKWKSSATAQYVGDPSTDCTARFVCNHLCVIALLDAIEDCQLARVEVDDESDYWRHRDARRLAELVGAWTEMVAVIEGQFRAAAEGIDVRMRSVELFNPHRVGPPTGSSE